MAYPGRVVRIGESDLMLVKSISERLAALGYPRQTPGAQFDAALASIVKLFQAQQVDPAGRPLRVDGEIGPMTWGALFGARAPSKAATGLAEAALAKAIGEIGVLEQPPGSNAGPKVSAYLASVGLGPGYYWCMAFVFWCFKQGADGTHTANPFPKTAGCLDAWNKVKAANSKRAISRAQVIANPGLVRPGMVFILDYGGGAGHTGFVKASAGGALRTVEGNTNLSGSGNGVGVFELNRRNVMDRGLKGFLDFN